MNTRPIISLLIGILLLLAVFIPTASHPEDQIIVDNADTIRSVNVLVDAGLVDATAGVGARIVSEFANTLRHFALITLPGQLQTLVQQVADRVVVEFANTTRSSPLSAVPGTLQTLIESVSDRVVFEFANTNREFELGYPTELINDSTPPQASAITTSVTGSDAATISWLTDEFADSAVLYGTQPGNYTQTISDPLYVKEHAIILLGLTPGTTYYYKVHSIDQSGNTFSSGELNFTVLLRVYLPEVIR